MVMVSLSTTTSTPISTGRASSAEAAKTTCEIMSLKSATLSRMAPSMSGHGQGRELLGVDALDVGVGGAAAHVQGLGGGVQVQADLLLRQGAHQVGEGARRDGGGAFLFDLGADPAGDAQFQVGGRQAQAAFIAGDQDVRKHRQGAARRNGTARRCSTHGPGFLARRLLSLLCPLLNRSGDFSRIGTKD